MNSGQPAVPRSERSAAESQRPSAEPPSTRTRIALVVAAAAAVGVVAVRNPDSAGSVGVCPLRALTGLDCPFCGGLRGTHALLHGDVVAALDHNVLLPLLLGLMAWLFAAAFRRGSVGITVAFRAQQWWFLGVALVAFGIIRNLPGVPFLDSAA